MGKPVAHDVPAETRALVNRIATDRWKKGPARVREVLGRDPHRSLKALEKRREESLSAQGRSPWGEPRVSYIFNCRGCGAELPRGCPNHVDRYVSPLSGKRVTRKPFPCAECGRDPWDSRGDRAPAVGRGFKPYVSVQYDPSELPGHFDRKAGGVVVKSREDERSFAARTGKRLVRDIL